MLQEEFINKEKGRPKINSMVDRDSSINSWYFFFFGINSWFSIYVYIETKYICTYGLVDTHKITDTKYICTYGLVYIHSVTSSA